MQAMFWKEWQEQRWKIIAIWGCILGMQLYRVLAESGMFFDVFRGMNGLISFALLVIPLVMGLDVLCMERVHGTLAFLRSRPLSALQIIFPKFAVGSAALFGAIVLLIGPMYFSMSAPMTEDQMVVARVVDMVPFWRLVWLVFISYWAFYTLSFTGSVLTDNPAKAFFVAVLLLFAFVFLISHPGGGENERLRVVVPFEDHGLAVLVANATSYMMMLTFGMLVFVGVCFACCIGVFQRFRQFSVHWAFVVGLIVLMIAFGRDFVDTPPAEAIHRSRPAGILPLEGLQRELTKAGDHVFVSGKKGLTVVDVSKSVEPKILGEIETPKWTFDWMDTGNETVYGTGWHRQAPDSLKYAGVIAFDVSDPTVPRLKSELDLVSATGVRQIGPVSVSGNFAYVCVVDKQESRVVVVEDTADGLRLVHKYLIDRTSDFDLGTKQILLDDAGGRPNHSLEELPWLSLNMVGFGKHLVVAASSGLVILDISNPRALKELSRVPFHDAWAKYLGAPRRGVDVDQNKVYVNTYFPEALTVFDIRNPAAPVLVSRFLFSDIPQSLKASGSHIYYSESMGHNGRRMLTRSLNTAPVAAYGQTFYKSQIDDDRRNRPILIEDGSLFTLTGDSLAIYNHAITR